MNARSTAVRRPHLLGSDRIDRARIAELLRRVELLPPDAGRRAFARNWLASALALWDAGERAAARYQVALVRKALAPRDPCRAARLLRD